MTLIVYVKCTDGHVLTADRKESDDANLPNPVRKYYMPDNQEFVLALAGSSIIIDMVVDSLHARQDITGEKVVEYLRGVGSPYFKGNVPDVITGVLMAKVGGEFKHYKVTISNSMKAITEDDPGTKCYGSGDVIGTYLVQKLLPLPLECEDALPRIIEIMDETATVVDTVGSIAKYGVDVFVFRDGGKLRHHLVKSGNPTAGIECRLVDEGRAPSALLESAPSLWAASAPGPRTLEGLAAVAGTGLEISYEITGGTIDAASLSDRDASVVMEITAPSSGTVSVVLPRDLIDARSGGADEDLCVLLDGEETGYREAKSERDRTVTVGFDSGSTLIEVIGTETRSGRAAAAQGGGPSDPPVSGRTDRRALSIHTDRPKYDYGSEIIATIFNPYSRPGQTMRVEVLDASEAVLHSRDIPAAADARGRYQHVVQAEGEGWRSGSQYSVRCTFGGRAASATISLSSHPIRLSLDKDRYSWRDMVGITVAAPEVDLPSGGGGGGEIGGTGTDYAVSLRTGEGTLDEYRLIESRPGSGIFVGHVRLTGFADASTAAKGLDTPGSGATSGNGPFDGELACGSDDVITLAVASPSGIVEKSAKISWTLGTIKWLEESYESPGRGMVRLYDADIGGDPRVPGTASIKVKSGADREGIEVTLLETGAGTGIYEGAVYFDPDEPSSGRVLRTAAEDVVVAHYADTAPPPGHDSGSTLPVTAAVGVAQPTEIPRGVTASNPRIVDADGNTASQAGVGEDLRVCVDFVNKASAPKRIVMGVTINGGEGADARQLDRQHKVIGPGKSLTLSAPWKPAAADGSSLEILVGASGRRMPQPSPLATLPISVVDAAKAMRPGAGPPGTGPAGKGDPNRNPPGSQNHVCRVGQDGYAPGEMSVRPGHVVTWVNEDVDAHTITSGTSEGGPDGMFDSGLIGAGSSFSHRFQRKGRYRYFCTAHPWQDGTVTVT